MIDHIGTLYFRYESVGWHAPGCSRRDTDQWEVTQHIREESGSLPRKVTLRFLCTECGYVRFETFEGEPTSEATHVRQIGYGDKPERVLGLWLHPGPRFSFLEQHGPTAFYVTRTKDRPGSPADVLGAVAWRMGRRGGIRWDAGLGCTGYGSARTASPLDFASRRAAVAWINEQPLEEPS